MSGSRGRDTAALVLLAIALVASVVELFYRPFGVAPIGFLAVLIAAGLSARHRRFGVSATGIVSVCFLIGAAIAVWQSNPLY
jgi:hypothetical protein